MVSCKSRVTVRLPKELSGEIRQHANKLGISMNAYIIMVLSEWIERKVTE